MITENTKSHKEWKATPLEDVLDYIQPTKYIVKSTKYSDHYSTPVLTAGKTFVLGKTNEQDGIFRDLPVIIFDDFTTATKFVNFPFKVKSSAMKILKPATDEVDLRFVYYYMQTIKMSSTTHKRYWISIYAKENILLPPLPIQQRIVEKIETLFTQIDAAIHTLNILEQQNNLYRQTVLQQAFEGKLVDVGEMKWVKLADVCNIKRGKSKHRPRNEPTLFGGKYPFIQTGDIRNANGGYISTCSQTYSDKGLEQSKLWEKGTLCITIAANIGETAILKIDACFPDSVVGITVKDVNDAAIKYVNYYLIQYKPKLEKEAPATAQKNINVDILEKIPIPMTSIINQQRIVDTIEKHLSVADSMQQTIAQSILQAKALKQSILQKAFSGALIPNN